MTQQTPRPSTLRPSTLRPSTLHPSTLHPSTLQSLDLAGWATTDGTPAALGSLSGVLGDFLAAPLPIFVVPAQRSANLLEVSH